MKAVLHLLWDLSQPGAACTVSELEKAVHDTSLERFTGLDGLCSKVWFRDGHRYGSIMVFEDRAARDRTLPWIADRIQEVTGLEPVRFESYDCIAVAEGAVGFTADRP